MVDFQALQDELRQARQGARQSRIACQRAAAEIEDHAEAIRLAPPAGLWPRLTRRGGGLNLVVGQRKIF